MSKQEYPALSKCPFCGDQAVWCDFNAEDKHKCHHIVCPSCLGRFDMGGDDDHEELIDLRAACAEKFNTRPKRTGPS